LPEKRSKKYQTGWKKCVRQTASAELALDRLRQTHQTGSARPQDLEGALALEAAQALEEEVLAKARTLAEEKVSVRAVLVAAVASVRRVEDSAVVVLVKVLTFC
ncbi:hypothetical protein ANCDUO_26111, partial [Ancylostoma duodenale]